MLILAYIIWGALVLGLIFTPLFWRAYRNQNAFSRMKLLNIVTILHCIIYLGLTLYIIFQLELPVYAFNHYMFIDPLAIFEVLITCVIFLLAAIYGCGYVKQLVEMDQIKPESLELFYGSFNFLLLIIICSFLSNNLALFWILLELTTILSAVLIVILSAKENIIAALKYVFIASTAMLFSVIGLIILFAMVQQATGQGTLNWSELMQSASTLSPKLFTFAFIFIFIGFASKAGIAPFHTWLPQAHAKAPSMVSAILSAVLLNCGVYGILRIYAVAYQTPSSKTVSIILVIFGLISIAVAAFSMLSRTNIKKLIGFSSIEHMGLVLIGISIGAPIAIFWTLFHIVAHSLIKSLLFFSAGILNHQYESNKMPDMKNAFKLQPLAAWGIIIGSAAVIGMPPFPVFLSKLFILTQLANISFPLLFALLVLFLIVASAMTYLLIKTFSQQSDSIIAPYKVHWTLQAPIIILLVAIVATGVYLSPSVSSMLNGIVSSLGF